MKWTIRNKILAAFGAVVILLVILAIINWSMMSAGIKAIELARDKGYAGALLAVDIKYDAAQVWQWLTDISATRAAEGLDDGFDEAERYAKLFHLEVAALLALYPEKQRELDELSRSFEAFYEKGQWMACQYIDGGPEAGNAAKKESDLYAQDITTRLEQLVTEMTGEAEAALQFAMDRNAQSRPVRSIFALGAVVLAMVMSLVLSSRISGPILTLRDVAIALADGDLTREIQTSTKTRDKVDELRAALGTMIATWRRIVGSLHDDATRLSTTAAQLAGSSEELSRTASFLSDEISRTSSGVEEMAATIQEVARNAGLAAQAATDSSQRAQAGGELASNTADGLRQADEIMQRLRTRSDEIGTIVSLIQEIAAQTNILALNAAIEAAGAGAAGARFDVVAEEIRNLAGRASQATSEIAELIGAVQSDTRAAAEAISKGVAMAQESGAALTNIVEASASVNDMVQSISSATEEQSRASQEMANSLDAMVSGSQQTATATRETAQIVIELSNLAERLKEAADQFKV